VDVDSIEQYSHFREKGHVLQSAQATRIDGRQSISISWQARAILPQAVQAQRHGDAPETERILLLWIEEISTTDEISGNL
jgi:hypothetical protein